MNRTDERILDDELETYLRLAGLPLPLAVWAAWISLSVSWQGAFTLDADAKAVYETLVPWFAHHPDGKLVRAEERQGTFEMRGVVVVDGGLYRVNSPKVVLATVSIAPVGRDKACVTIAAAAKISRLSSQSARRRVTAVCEAAAEEIIEHLRA
ncbi:MAG TPA: hypothetical protein VF116_21485 [Ktedonobacterales bacterium]